MEMLTKMGHWILYSVEILNPLAKLSFVFCAPHEAEYLTAGTMPPVPRPQSPTLASCFQPAAGCWLVPTAGR